MNMNSKNKGVLVGVTVGMLGFAAATVHFGCKEGAGVTDIRRGLVSTIGQVTGQQKAADTLNVGVDAAQAIQLDAEDENVMGQNVALSITNSYPLTKDEKLNKYVS